MGFLEPKVENGRIIGVMKRLLVVLLFAAIAVSAQPFKSGQTYEKDGVRIALHDAFTSPATYFCLSTVDKNENVTAFAVIFSYISNGEPFITSKIVEYSPATLPLAPRRGCAEVAGSKVAGIVGIAVMRLKAGDVIQFNDPN